MPRVLPTSRQATPNLATLPPPALRMGDFPPEEFVQVPDVPIFSEHQKKIPPSYSPEGEMVKEERLLSFGQKELQAVVNRCNRRIAETGDYAVVCFGHIRDPESGLPPPDVAGFAGPYKLGAMRLPGGKLRFCILATFWIYKDQYERFRRCPRRSPELWIEDTYDEMFFDPISLLGAEPPALDMGLLYSLDRTGKQILKYSASPSSMNAFTPAMVDGDATKHYSATADNEGDSDMSDPKEIAELVLDAIQQLPVWQFMESQMQQQNMAGEGGTAMATGGAAGEATADPSLTATPPATPASVESPPAVDPTVAAPAVPAPAVAAQVPPPAPVTPAAPPVAPQATAEVEPPAEVPPPADSAAVAPDAAASEATETAPAPAPVIHADIHQEEGADGSVPPVEAAEPEPEGDETKSPAERERMQRYEALDSAMEGMSGEEVEQYMCHRKGKYQAGDEPASAPPSDSIPAEPSVTECSVEKYSRDYARKGIPLQYAKELGEMQVKIDRLNAEKIDSERLTKLRELRADGGYMLDPAEEMEVCRYGKMSDADFGKHVERIAKHYQRSPSAVTLPSGLLEHLSTTNRLSYTDSDREKYAKEATKICTRLNSKGKQVDFETVLQDVTEGQAGKYAEMNGRATVAAK